MDRARLRQIIKEELSRAMNETEDPFYTVPGQRGVVARQLAAGSRREVEMAAQSAGAANIRDRYARPAYQYQSNEMRSDYFNPDAKLATVERFNSVGLKFLVDNMYSKARRLEEDVILSVRGNVVGGGTFVFEFTQDPTWQQAMDKFTSVGPPFHSVMLESAKEGNFKIEAQIFDKEGNQAGVGYGYSPYEAVSFAYRDAKSRM